MDRANRRLCAPSRRVRTGAPAHAPVEEERLKESLHSIETLVAELGTRCQHLCRLKSDLGAPRVRQITEPTPIQKRALELIAAFLVPGNARP